MEVFRGSGDLKNPGLSVKAGIFVLELECPYTGGCACAQSTGAGVETVDFVLEDMFGWLLS